MGRLRGCFLVFLILLLLVAGYIVYRNEWYQRRLIEHSMDVPIPDNATNVQYTARAWQGSALFLKFDIPSADLDIFLSELCFPAEADLKEDYHLTRAYNSPAWWMPDEAVLPIGEFCGRDDGMLFEIVIDTQKHTTYTVYLAGLSA